MNRLSIQKRAQIIQLLVEGNSMRAASRITGVAFNTVLKLLPSVGEFCTDFHNQMVTNVPSKRVQVDEIWSFVGAKEKNVRHDHVGYGDAWLFVAIDADTKLILSWYCGERDSNCASIFLKDLASRIVGKIQLTSDGFNAYPDAVQFAFGDNVDFAQLVKQYGTDFLQTERKYSPLLCTGANKVCVTGTPDEKYISTSYVERQNLTLRMSNRRFTRLTNGFSKSMENHIHSLSLHYVYHNFCRIHQTLKTTPAIAAGVTQDILAVEDIAELSLM